MQPPWTPEVSTPKRLRDGAGKSAGGEGPRQNGGGGLQAGPGPGVAGLHRPAAGAGGPAGRREGGRSLGQAGGRPPHRGTADQ